jgi:Putative Flp pilus-assembly TadE/G-like
MKPTTRIHRGQTIVVVTLALVATLCVLALATDVGVAYFNWAQLQKAADAAAVAGAHYLPTDGASAKSTAVKFGGLNAVKSSEITQNEVATDNMSISVGFARDVPTHFARVLGFTSFPVSVQATAALKGIGAARGFLPIGLYCDQQPLSGNCGYVQGKLYQLKQGIEAPGNWGAIAPSGPGGNDLRDGCEWGYRGDTPIKVGDNVSTKPGNDAGPVRQGIDARLARSTEGGSAPPSPIDPADSRVVLVPLVDFAAAGGRSGVPVVGFITMWIASVDSQGVISAYMIPAVTGDPSGDAGAPNTGGYAVSLIR